MMTEEALEKISSFWGAMKATTGVGQFAIAIQFLAVKLLGVNDRFVLNVWQAITFG